MLDGFLWAHKWQSGPFFDLSRRHNTISIRDQMMRGWMLAERLPAWLTSHSKKPHKVLIVGGGACGVTAAIALARSAPTIKVTLAEREKKPFFIQSHSTTRWVDPMQYDWPMDHWEVAKFPLSSKYEPGSKLPLGWSAQFSKTIVTDQWLPRWANLSGKSENLEVLENTFVHSREPLADKNDKDNKIIGYEVTLTQIVDGKKLSEAKDNFSAVVWAGGVRGDRTTCPIRDSTGKSSRYFFSFPFWDEEDYHKLTPEKKVVISGGGDGALQDLLRVLTGLKSARKVLKKCGVTLDDPAIQAIHSAEHRLERTKTWDWSKRNSRTENWFRLQTLYENCVKDLLDRRKDVQEKLTDLMNGKPKEVYVLYREKSIGCIYGLNRFVATLLMMIEPSRIVTHSEHELTEVSCQTDDPDLSRLTDPATLMNSEFAERAKICMDLQWTVYGNQPDKTGKELVIEDVDVLIVRHGLLDKEMSTADEDILPASPDPEMPIYVPLP